VKRYGLEEPIDEVGQLMNQVRARFGIQDSSTANAAFLRDFRDGTLGNVTLDGLIS